MLGWQESTLMIQILELYEEFDNLVTVSLYMYTVVIKPLSQFENTRL